MISRSTIGRSAQLALRRQCCAQPAGRRGFAAASSGSTAFSYDTADVNGVKVASRDVAGPTTSLAIVAKAGSRYETTPGAALGLEHFAFKSTANRSALRITRETEILGSELVAYHTREALVIGAKFLKEDLPYFTELLSEVASKTKFSEYEYHEEIESIIHLHQKKFVKDTAAQALNYAHTVAFHDGLGSTILPLTEAPLHKYLSGASVKSYASAALTKSNIAVVANGAAPAEVSKWVGEFFSELPAGSSSLSSTPSKYYGGESRVASDSGNSVVLAFPGSSSFGSSSYKPELSVLASLLGGESTIKWSPGFSLLSKASAGSGASVSTKNIAYSDAGLLTVQISGSASAVRSAVFETVKVIKAIAEGTISSEDLTKATSLAKFNALSEGENVSHGILATGSGLIHGGKPYQIEEIASGFASVSADKVKAAAKSLLDSKATVASVGDLYALPYAEELGLKV